MEPMGRSRIRETPGDIDPFHNKPLKRARSRVKKGRLQRGLPNTTLNLQLCLPLSRAPKRPINIRQADLL